jgi:hypothetical protein
MTVREQNLDTIAPVLATFEVNRTTGTDDLAADDIGCAVTLTSGGKATAIGAGEVLVGRLISVTTRENEATLSTVQVGGICRLAISTTYPQVGDRVVGGAAGTVKQAPAVASDPAGGNVARGTVLAVNGTTDAVILLN